MKPITFEVPGLAPSAPNLREHYMQRSRRVNRERSRVRYRIPKDAHLPALVVVTLTRVAPRPLDSDNVQGALKGTRDQVAAWLGVDDRSPLVRWEYAQERAPKTEARVRVEVRLAESSTRSTLATVEAQPPPAELHHGECACHDCLQDGPSHLLRFDGTAHLPEDAPVTGRKRAPRTPARKPTVQELRERLERLARPNVRRATP